MKLTKLLENEFTNKSHSSDNDLYLSLKLKSDSLVSELTHLQQQIVKIGASLQVPTADAEDVARYAENGKISEMWNSLTSQQEELFYATKKICDKLRRLSKKQKDAREDFMYVDHCVTSNTQIDQNRLHGSYTYDTSNY